MAPKIGGIDSLGAAVAHVMTTRMVNAIPTANTNLAGALALIE
jgi:hypothetical protein